jgi:glycosyltransferase involved in cell wall biosynthesis/SAM-dependent methyltransferase
LVEARAETDRQRATMKDLSRHLAGAKANLQSMRRSFASRYRNALQDPSMGLEAQLKRGLFRGLERFVPPMRAKVTAKLEMHRQGDLIRHSLLFDREWYLAKYRDVATAGMDPALHYLWHGAAEGRDPSPEFSTTGYLRANPDVTPFGNPLLHYILHGEAEGRDLGDAPPDGSAGLYRLPEAPIASAPTTNEILLSILYVSAEPTTPGNSYRVTRYVEAAAANGVAASWMPQASLAGRLHEVSSYDVLVLWRTPWDEAIAKATATMKGLGRTVVFDVDDLMVDPNLASTSIIDGIRSQHFTEEMVRDHYGRVRQTMLAADICTATTHELAHYMREADKPVFVLPNGFDQTTHDLSREAARQWRRQRDGLIRIGYAGGSRTHQRDLGLAVDAIARVLLERPECRLVLFRTPDGKVPLIDIEEYPALSGLHDRIEWRPLQPLANLPQELARFDINLAPLEFGNPFCEAKSELKFFEAALVEVPTVASPTGPFRRVIDHGRTGFLAASADDWYFHLDRLAGDAALRACMGRDAYHATLAAFGPRQRMLQFGRFVDQMRGGAAAARGFALDVHLRSHTRRFPRIYPSDVVFEQDKGGEAAVSVVFPLYNYEQYVVEALESVRRQTLEKLDLIVVDGHSTDNSLAVALKWARSNARRFNRVLVLQNRANYGLGLCRNSGFDVADTPYVMLLDADNRLLPECCARLLAAMQKRRAAYVYPSIRHFGASDRLISAAPYAPQRFVAGNYIDAMALVSKEAWAIVGGIDHVRFGWEDYDLWCRFAEVGMAGEWLPEILAEYRVHPQSMMTVQTLAGGNYRDLQENFTARHPWIWLRDRHLARVEPHAGSRVSAPEALTRLDQLLAILRCPVSGQKLGYDKDRTALRSYDGLQSWPIVSGRPVLSPLLLKPAIHPPEHISNELPDEALDTIRSTSGWVMNLSAGGSREKLEHVVEVEYNVFRHTDVVADAHVLPFDDASFDAVISMNAFEHYREPQRVAAEILRVLKPGGRVHIRTAFLQPLHERPWHFYPCTRYGLEEWFRAFEIERLHVSENFCPNHTISWIATELDRALRNELSAEAGERFSRATVTDFVQLWTDPSKRTSPLWTDLQRLSQSTQEVTAAGFELMGRKPLALPDLLV